MTCVTVVLQWCYSGVTVVLQWCHSGVAVVAQLFYNSISIVLKWCYNDFQVYFVRVPLRADFLSASNRDVTVV
jgi:hypothetical protein